MWKICFLSLKGPLSAERWRQVDSQVDMHPPYSPPRAFSPKAEPHPRAHLSVRIEMPLTRPGTYSAELKIPRHVLMNEAI